MRAIDRLAEASADATAAAVGALQSLSARRRSFSLRRAASSSAKDGARYLVRRLLPQRARAHRGRSAGMTFLHLLVAGGVPATSTFARLILLSTVRAAPVVWKVSRDRRAQATAALLLRIIFGHKRRPSR